MSFALIAAGIQPGLTAQPELPKAQAQVVSKQIENTINPSAPAVPDIDHDYMGHLRNLQWEAHVLQQQSDARAAKEAAQAALEATKAQEAVVAQSSEVRAVQQPTTPVAISGTCSDWMSQAGISSEDQTAAAYIFDKESGCRPTASNPSGAYGVCQSLPASKMASAGADYMTNPVTQMKWCSSYAASRYGGWQGAYSSWLSKHWW